MGSTLKSPLLLIGIPGPSDVDRPSFLFCFVVCTCSEFQQSYCNWPVHLNTHLFQVTLPADAVICLLLTAPALIWGRVTGLQ